MPAQTAFLFASGHIPQLDGLVPTAAGQGFAIGAKGHASHVPPMPAQTNFFFAAGHIPQLNGLVLTYAGQGFTIRAKGHASHAPLMPDQTGFLFAAGHIPQLNGLVLTAAGQGFAIGAKDHTSDRIHLVISHRTRPYWQQGFYRAIHGLPEFLMQLRIQFKVEKLGEFLRNRFLLLQGEVFKAVAFKSESTASIENVLWKIPPFDCVLDAWAPG